VIKNDKSELFFNQLWKWENKEENSLNEKLKSFILKRLSYLVWDIIIYLEQPSKSKKYQNDIIEIQINNFVKKTKQIIHILNL